MVKRNREVGFSGLAGLASNISDLKELASKSETVTNAEQLESTKHPSENKNSDGRPCGFPKMSPSDQSGLEGDRTGETRGGNGDILVLAAVLIVFGSVVLALIYNGAFLSSTSRPSTSQSLAHGPDTPKPVKLDPAPIDNVSATAELKYEMPPAGTENELSIPEICWCIRENIRIESMREISETARGVETFNGLVDDYNSRCGSFRYREGAIEQAKLLVESQRSMIVSEAMEEMMQLGSPPTPSQAKSSLDDWRTKRPNYVGTREAQEILTALGYNPGPIDGDYGRITSDAVRAFQKNVGLPEDGVIDEELLALLRDAKVALKPIVTPPLPAPPSRADNYSVPNATDDATTALATPKVISRQHTQIRRNNAAERRRNAEEEQKQYEDIKIDFQPIYIDPKWRVKKRTMEAKEEPGVEVAEPTTTKPTTSPERVRPVQPIQESHLFTVHFKSGLTQPADDVIDADPYYRIKYGRRSFDVRKDIVKEVEKHDF